MAPLAGVRGGRAAAALALAACLALAAASGAGATASGWRARPHGPAASRRLLGGSFAESSACAKPPTAKTSTPDRAGRLWGWENARSCAFRVGDKPVLYTGYEPGNWVTVPACLVPPFAPNAATVGRRCACMGAPGPCGSRMVLAAGGVPACGWQNYTHAAPT